MKLLRLEISNFGKFNNKILELEENLVLIQGVNESGKSTIVKFIEGVFYGFVKPYLKNTRYTDDLDKYRPWNGMGYEGSIVLQHNEKIYRVYRNFEDGNYVIYNELTGKDITSELENYQPSNKSFPGEYFFKVSSDVFNNTKIIGQNNVGIDDKSTIYLTDTLLKNRNKTNMSNSSFKSIEYLKGLKRNIGTKSNTNKPLGSTYEKYQDISEKTEEIIKLKSQYDKSIAKIREYENEIESKNHLLDLKNRQLKFEEKEKITGISEEKNRLLAKINDLKKREAKLQAEKDRFESVFVQVNKINEEKKYIKIAFDELSIIKREKYKENNRISTKIDEVDQEIKEERSNKVKYFTTIASMILGVAVFMSLIVRFTGLEVFPAILLVLLFSLLLFFLIKKPQAINSSKLRESLVIDKKNIDEDILNIDKEIEYLLNDEEIKEKEFKELEKNLNLKYGMSFKDIDSKVSELENIERTLSELNDRLDFIVKSYSKFSVDDLEHVDFSKEFYLVENLDIDDLLKQKEDINIKLSKLKGEITFWDKEVKNLPNLLEKKDFLKKQIDKLEKDIQILDLTVDLIDESFEESKINFLPGLNKQINHMLEPIFNSSREFYIDENLNISFKKDNESNLKSILSLSKGSKDIIYLVLKIAISNQLFGKSDFIILDDALNYLDDSRLKEFLFNLNKIKQNQLIILTCQERESRILKEVLEIPIIEL
ncbi:AAA family ATPase [Lagierella sp.]|uniref:ATP-binding protein n=1 Tax=Lagierella sp. TaxID=2849657 RepID=UPI002614A762|nr:AAA family ATPase [Lagierella sp.]